MRSAILGRWLLLAAAAVTLAGCRRISGGAVSAFIPTAPSVPTAQPLVWDSADELSGWVNNSITKGRVSIEGTGNDAFIRAVLAPDGLLLRGPDFEPPVAGVRSMRVRYRWAYGGTPQPGSGHLLLFAVLQPTQMSTPAVPTVSMDAVPTGGAWRESTMTFPDSQWAPLSTPMRYARLGDGAGDVFGNYSPPPGTLDIDWIRLER